MRRSYKDWRGKNLSLFRSGVPELIEQAIELSFPEYTRRKRLASASCEGCGVVIEDEHRSICLECWQTFVKEIGN